MSKLNKKGMTKLKQTQQALSRNRYETARRIAEQAIREGDDCFDLRMALHEAYVCLGDYVNARGTLKATSASNSDQSFSLALLQAEDYYKLANAGHYRKSEEALAGLSVDEYMEKYRNLSAQTIEEAQKLVVTDAHRERLAAAEALCGKHPFSDSTKKQVLPELPNSGKGVIRGTLFRADGRPAANIKLVLGLEVPCIERDPTTYVDANMHYLPTIGPQRSLETTTNSEGSFVFKDLPAGKHEFIAACLDPLADALSVHFLAHDLKLVDDGALELKLTLTDWVSAEPESLASRLSKTVTSKGINWDLVHWETLKNPFHYDFPRQVIHIDLPDEIAATPTRLRVLCSEEADVEQPFQLDGSRLSFFAELKPLSERSYGIYLADASQDNATESGVEITMVEDEQIVILDTGRAAFKLPLDGATADLAPIMAVRGEDGVWRGRGRWQLPDGVSMVARKSRVISQGPVSVTVEQRYTLSSGQELVYEFMAQQGEALLQVRETSAAIEGVAFEFSLAEFSGGRGFLHWCPENGNVHWSSLSAEKRELARLQESVAWWIPPEGFGYAMTADSLDQQDYIGVVTLRRGEWIDRYFETICRGPGDDQRELDWPFPEMVGSTVSMITAHTDTNGDAWFRFGAFDGERQWGLLVSTLDRNDGTYKDISSAQHKNSSPRLQEFKDWHLDEQDRIQRPFVLTKRDKLIQLREKESKPCFKEMRQHVANWESIGNNYDSFGSKGLDAMLCADPLKIWALKKEIAGAAHIRSRMTLLGRDYSDMYSPVGARSITPWAEVYDLIAATGVFTPAEERITRSCLMLMGHMYMQCDLMNWKYGSRNANFEADRVDVVGGIGLTFHGGSDSQQMIDHCVSLMRTSLDTYCTPGSGKWYENPACYYLHASNCRLNLAFHLWEHGLYDVTQIPRMKDYLSWALHITTAPYAHDNELLRDGATAEQYATTGKVRRVPPIGDHAHLGQWFSEYFALMGMVYRKSDPEFAQKLFWLYQSGGNNGGHFSRHALFYCHAEEEDLIPVEAPALASRRLEGFGAVLRNNVHTEDESYCIFKLGPGGYRYHRTEGSIILIENGKPLIFDGGEAGETWRHTTLSFGETHMPLAPGHVERFVSHERCDFVQGVHPKALQPGDPVFLSDNCDHRLVQLAHQRFSEANPANSRSLLHVKSGVKGAAKGGYYILHDQLHLEDGQLTHWHLQAVADEHEGDWKTGYHFKGRFGTDLQVLLPGQEFDRERVRQDPLLEYHLKPEETFAMRHLQLSATAPQQILAVIRPLHPGDEPLQAEMQSTATGGCIVKVTGPGIDDWHCFDRHGLSIDHDQFHFEGRYGSVIKRGSETSCIMHDGTELKLH
jgi:hypothetical protein